MSDFVSNISYCLYIASQQISSTLVYYAHIPVIIVGLFFAVYFLIKDRKNLITNYLFSLFFLFSLWAAGNLITWTMSHDSPIIMFAWSTLELIEVSFFFVSLNFAYYFFFDKNIPLKFNLLLIVPIIPVAYFTLTNQILINYDLLVCEATESYGKVWYAWFADLLYMTIIIVSFIISLKKKPLERVKNSFFFGGLFIFSILYLVALYIAEYVENYNWSLFAMAGMPIFLAILAFSAVRYGIFNIKILGAQILVFLSVFIVATQYIFIENTINHILNGVTLLVLIVGGVMLIRSVKVVDRQRTQLEIANHEQENLIHFISHQVKGFFTKSRNIFSMLADEKDTLPEGLHSFIEEGLRSDNEGISTVSNILNAANLKSGTVQYNKNKFHLNILIEKIIADDKKLADAKGLNLSYEYKDGLIEFNGDEQRLRDAFANLIQNAIHYTFKGEIKVSLKKDLPNKKVIFEVKDTGVGLTSADKVKLFKSGGRGVDSLKYNVNSTGYGLFIAKQVIEKHGGTVTAESEGRDKGSTFTVILPIV